MTRAQAGTFSLQIEADGVAWLTFGRPGGAVNVLGDAVLAELDGWLEKIEGAITEGLIRALLLRSATPGTWLAGHDLNELAAVRDAADGETRALRAQAVLSRLEALPVPTVAVIDGACLGSGTELALACAFRLASDSPRTRIGLPETRMGLLPGLGATVRLPRVIGFGPALEMILGGQSVDPPSALSLGLVDRVVAPAEVQAEALRFARARVRSRSGARARSRRPGVVRRLAESAPGRGVIVARTLRRMRSWRGGGTPAVRRALEVVAEGVGLSETEALRRAAQALGKLVVSPESRALLHVFRITQAAKRPPVSTAAWPVEHAGVLGAGGRGAEIAHLLAGGGLDVRLRDAKPERIERAREYARLLFAEQAARGLLRDAEIAERMARIVGKAGLGGFGTLDLVIDAGESAAPLASVEPHVSERCILATAAPLASVGELQQTLRHPERAVGLHLKPLPRTRLIEIVPGSATAPGVVATAHALARRLGKTALVVADAPGFLLHRLLVPYAAEAVRLLEEGASVQQVDGALRAFGVALEPLRLLDEMGVDEFARIATHLAERLGERFNPPALVERMLHAGRAGRGAGRGFYAYDRTGAERGTESELYALVHTATAAAEPRPEVPTAEIEERVLLALTNEAAYALGERIVQGPGTIDLAAVRGLGYPALRGGPLWNSDVEGPGAVRERLEALSERLGPRFRPAPLLEEGRSFYREMRPSNPSGQGEDGVIR